MFIDFQEIIIRNVDVVIITETKTDASFRPFPSYHSPYRLDKSRKSGDILVYVKSSVPSRRLSCENLCDSTQAVSFEINLRKEKWLVISIHRPPSQNQSHQIIESVNILHKKPLRGPSDLCDLWQLI